jgi:hypothetical protein
MARPGITLSLSVSPNRASLTRCSQRVAVGRTRRGLLHSVNLRVMALASQHGFIFMFAILVGSSFRYISQLGTFLSTERGGHCFNKGGAHEDMDKCVVHVLTAATQPMSRPTPHPLHRLPSALPQKSPPAPRPPRPRSRASRSGALRSAGWSALVSAPGSRLARQMRPHLGTELCGTNLWSM